MKKQNNNSKQNECNMTNLNQRFYESNLPETWEELENI